MKVRFYGRLADLIGRDVEAAPGGSVADLRRHLQTEYPGAANDIARSKAVVADAVIDDNHPLATAHCVEFLPPVSGG